jgi:hypothetical protein
MGLYDRPGVSVESWVEMSEDVPMRYEADVHNDMATLHFGQRSEYVLTMNRDALIKVAAIATQAIADLTAADQNP